MIELLGWALLVFVAWKLLSKVARATVQVEAQRSDETRRALEWNRPPSAREFFRVATAVALQTMIATFLACSVLVPLGGLIGRLLRGGK